MIKHALVTRTPFSLVYEIVLDDEVDAVWIPIGSAELERDASGWRDRPIHRLTATPVADLAAARALFQGIGLTAPSTTGLLRGRLSLLPMAARAWSVETMFDPERGRAYLRVGVGATKTPHNRRETHCALVTLEVERNR